MSKSEEYWRKREEEQRKKNIEDEEEYAERIKYYYRQEMNAIEDRIYAFYVRYSTKEGITMAEARRRVSKMDVEEFAEMAAKYVKEKDFSDRANEELRLYNLTMRVNYQQLLMYQIAMESCATADELEQFMKSKLEGRTIDEIERQAGILGESLLDQKEMVGSIVNASFHNATFSDRIWANQALLRSNLSNILTNALIQGRNPRDYIKQIRRAFDVSRGQAERLLRTELARVQSEAQLRSYEKAEFDMYTFHALGDACSVCAALDGEHFEVKEAEPGINLPPMHPNCRCSTGPYMDTEDFDEWLDGIDEHGLTWDEWKETKKMASHVYTGDRWPSHAKRITKKQYRDLVERANQTGVKLKGFENFQGDPEAVNKILDGIKYVLDDFPDIRKLRNGLQIRLKYPKSKEDADMDYAESDGHSIFLNGFAFRSKDSLSNAYKIDSNSGWFVKGSDISAIAYHEMGHIVSKYYNIDCKKVCQNALQIKDETVLLRRLSKDVSEYAALKVDCREAVAECFSAYYSGNINETSLKIYNEFVKMVLKKGGA